MIFYLVVIFVSMVLVASFNAAYASNYFFSPTYAVLATIILTASLVVIDGIFAFVIRRLPSKWFNSSHSIYDAKKKEKKFYDFIRIRKWKDIIPELGGFTNFHKDHVEDPNDASYLERFILECNYGSMIHLVGAVAGFLIIFITPLEICYLFAIPLAVVNAFLNLLPAFILRYNTPRLKSLLRFAKRKQAA